ncbi:hypothetical protein [Nonomuraea wenchangensis]|uniref:hypothetical protein n=1 Tax=Nonomuraea wenchangensis TaxID=568860 RepID=UPI00331E3C45
MATRGFLGFVIDRTAKIAYAHDDTYPAGVGLLVLTWLRIAAPPLDGLRKQAAAVRVVSPTSRPTPGDVARLAQYTHPCSSQVRHWWELLWQTQGDPEKILQAGVIEDASDFPADPHCEWGYVIDLDNKVLEVYRGGQSRPHQRGRFASDASAGAPWLVMGWTLEDLPTDREFLETLASA